MSQEGDNGEGGRRFKVVDRRRFTPEGEERSGPDIAEDRPHPAQAKPAAPAAAPVSAAAPAAAAPSLPAEPSGAPAAPDEEDGIPFAAFVQSLAQQAMMQMGLIPWPHTGQRDLQLEQARDTVDILAMLKAKTRGNLSAQEAKLIETALYELRMTWVEISQQLAARARGAGTPKA